MDIPAVPRTNERPARPDKAEHGGLILLTSGAVLVLEVIVNRLAAPFVGLTLQTYSASIGVALGAIALGAWLGGKLADRIDPRLWLGPATVLGGLLFLTARPVALAVGPLVQNGGGFATVLLVAAAVGPAVTVLSAISPGVGKVRLRELSETGRTVGRLSATGTLGALAGTFLTGFFLLQALPTSKVLLAAGLVLVLTGARTTSRSRRTAATPAALTGTLAVAVLAAGVGFLAVAEGPCDRETRYYCAVVTADPDNPTGRELVLDGIRHAYVDLNDPSRLEYDYTSRIGAALDGLPPGPVDVLHLGLGGGTIPRYVADARPGSTGTAIEVDPGVVDINTDLLGLGAVPDLTVLTGDARTRILRQPTGRYDAVVGDAFGSLSVPWHLTTREMIAQVRRVLRPGGVYVLNLVDHPPNRFVAAETATVREAFDHVLLLGTAEQAAGTAGGNFILVASDAPLNAASLAAAGAHDTTALTGDATVLTDDYAPVDQLLTPYPAN